MSRLLSTTRVRVLVVVLLSALIGVFGGAVPTASAAPGGQITGTVTNAAGDPVAGITVTAYASDTGEFGAQATTKRDGSYSLKKLGAASYTVEFMDNSGTPLYATEYYNDQTDFQNATPVAVGNGQTVSGIDAELARFGTISGTVTDEQGNPLPSGSTLYDILEYSPDGPPFTDVGGGQVPDNGHFSFPFVPAGTYLVYFNNLDGSYVSEYWNDKLSVFEADHVPVTAGATTSGIDARLARAGHVSGKVTDADGNGLGGIQLQLARLVGSEWWSYGEEFGFQTNDDGTYELDGLPPGTWRIGFQDPSGEFLFEYYDDAGSDFGSATDIPVTAGQTTSGIDAVLTRSSHVTGTVTDEQGNPLAGISVLLWHPSPDDGHPEIAADTETGADGTYTLSGFPAGTYKVSFQSQGDYADEYYDDKTEADATPIVVGPGATVTGIDAQLARAAHLTGSITDAAGNGFEFYAVDAYRWTGSTWEQFSTAFGGTDDNDPADDTHYDVGGLTPGTYRLEFSGFHPFTTDTGGGLELLGHEFYDDQPSLELAKDVVVTAKGQVLSGYDAVLVEGQYPDAVKSLTPPTISGTPKVGSPLTASPGTWNLKATTFHYQWLAGTTPVGIDAPSYTPTAADVGKTISVVVNGSVAGLGSATAKSAPTAPVAPATVVTPPPAPPKIANTERPVVKGSLVVGTKARVTHGRWTPAGVALTYKWFVGGKLVTKAHGSRLLLKAKWVGERIRVKVTATASGYLTTKVLSGRSPKITA